ncbi:hypothetical protein ACTJJ7_15400 [Phyllobacterium sp. 22229]|uniref:hypothetical protein n=1 Tax=Phyllobacterium sp. 22229 TaxID=3453895 RepID=UPI003F8268BB
MKTIEERLEALEMHSHEPFDFTDLIERLEVLEAELAVHQNDVRVEKMVNSSSRVSISDIRDQLTAYQKREAGLRERIEERADYHSVQETMADAIRRVCKISRGNTQGIARNTRRTQQGGRVMGKLTGGRPMQNIGCAFTDVVSGKPVYYWVDTLGRSWMANGAWSLFRVPYVPQSLAALTKGSEHE